MRTRAALAATIATAAAVLLVPAGAGAQERFPKCDPDCRILVNSTVDEPDANPGDGKCATAARKCTLRAAVQEANASADRPPFQSKILVPAGTYVLTRHGLDDTGDRGDLDVHFFGPIIGAGITRTVVDGDGADRVLDLHSDVGNNLVSHLAVRNGRATDGPGGGIRSTGFPNELRFLYVTDNEAVPGEARDSGNGGGVAGIDLHLFDSYVAYNRAQDGGGYWYHGAQSTAFGDTLRGNYATRNGGGVFYDSDDSFVHNFTISGNHANGRGGGLYITQSVRTATFTGSTIASNTAPTDSGAGIWGDAYPDPSNASRVAAGLIVARNDRDDCGGSGLLLTSHGGNLDSDETCPFGEPTDKQGIDPMIGPVAYNGGPTPTRALDPSSPAVDMWGCGGGYPDPLRTDQRGAERPQQETCDAGAFEVGLCCPAEEPPFIPGSNEDPSTPIVGDCGVIRQGTLGNDVMFGNDRRNELHGRDGDDRIYGGPNADCLFGGRGNDHVEGGDGVDTIYGGAGNDHLLGGLSEDVVYGGTGRDRIDGGPDEDRLYGGSGPDVIRGGDGYDKITAGPGDDVIDATGKGLDGVDCGAGEDRVRAKRGEHLYRCEHVKYVD